MTVKFDWFILDEKLLLTQKSTIHIYKNWEVNMIIYFLQQSQVYHSSDNLRGCIHVPQPSRRWNFWKDLVKIVLKDMYHNKKALYPGMHLFKNFLH